MSKSQTGGTLISECNPNKLKINNSNKNDISYKSPKINLLSNSPNIELLDKFDESDQKLNLEKHNLKNFIINQEKKINNDKRRKSKNKLQQLYQIYKPKL